MEAHSGEFMQLVHGGRREGRALASRIGWLRNMQGVWMDNPVVIENISSYGARLRSVRPWTLRECVDLSDSAIGLHVGAEVVYCEALADGHYAIGVKFDRRIELVAAGEVGR